MQAVSNNPYRVLGVLADATTKEISKQSNTIKKFLEAEQVLPPDYSFPELDNMDRSVETVDAAMSKLNLDAGKMNAALFWFYNGNDITDEPAFDALKEGDADTAYQIWDKLIIETGENGKRCWKIITEKNYSAFHNYFVLNMLRKNGNLPDAITGNLYFLESDLSQKFVSSVTDSTFRITTKELQINFLNEILQEIDKKTVNLTIGKLMAILNDASFSAKEDFFKSISQKVISGISAAIEASRKQRTANKANAAIAGERLYMRVINDLKQLKSITGIQNFTYSNIADKAANEIMQCGIDFFNDSQDKGLDNNYYEKNDILIKYAKRIAVGSAVKARLEENTGTLNEMKQQSKIKEYTDKILKLFDDLDSADTEKITKAKEIISLSKPELLKIKAITGGNDDLYMEISSHAANEVQQLINKEVNGTNKTQGKLIPRYTASFKEVLKNAWETTELAGSLDMSPEFLSDYQNNRNTLKDLCLKAQVPAASYNFPKIPQLHFIINSSEITNTDEKNNPLPVTNPLYKKYIKYIGLKINVEVFENQTIIIYMKYIDPEGKLLYNFKSPQGYTSSVDKSIDVNTKEIDLGGWENSDEYTYAIGKHSIELWVNNFMIHKQEFAVDYAPSEKLDTELKKAEDKLEKINNTQFYQSELQTANFSMGEIKKLHLFRSNSKKQRQIIDQHRLIDNVRQEATNEKERQIAEQKKIIYKLRIDIQNAEY